MHRRQEPPPPAISEQEFEEIFQRNKTVSSSAINRAVMDASSGKGHAFVTSLCMCGLVGHRQVWVSVTGRWGGGGLSSMVGKHMLVTD